MTSSSGPLRGAIGRGAADFRPMFFGAVLGIGGLASDWRAAARLWTAPWIIGEALALLALAIWLAALALYAWRWAAHPRAAAADLADPTTGLLAALAPIATLVASLVAAPIAPALGLAMLALGLAGVLTFAAWSIGGLWRGGRPAETTTPVLYMPTVGGGLVSAAACGTYGLIDLGWMFFGVGLLTWAAMESVILSRLFALGLPPERRAALGMHLAPAAVACVAWCALDPAPTADRFALMLFGYGCFLALVMLRLAPWLREQAFGPPAWGYTFGVSTLPLAAFGLIEKGAGSPVPELAVVLFVAANLIIGWIALRSAASLLRWAARPVPTPPR